MGRSTVSVRVTVRGFSVVGRSGQPAREGEGHLVFYEGATYEVPTAPNAKATIGGSGSFVAVESATSEYTWRNMDPGPRKLSAQLVGNDGAPLRPPRVADVTVTIR